MSSMPPIATFQDAVLQQIPPESGLLRSRQFGVLAAAYRPLFASGQNGGRLRTARDVQNTFYFLKTISIILRIGRMQ